MYETKRDADRAYRAYLVSKQEEEWRALHRLADGMEPRVREAFLAALGSLDVNVGRLTSALEAGDVDAALQAVASVLPANLRQQVSRSLRELASDGAQAAAGFVPFRVDDTMFSLVNEAAVEWADQYSFDLISGLDDESRDGVRQVIRDSIREGREPRRQARLIEQVVGLSERDALSADRMYQSMLEDGIDPDFALRRVVDARKRLLRRRAELIARTETIRAANQGQQLLWDRGVEDGLVPPMAGKVWIATPDDRACPRCLGLDGSQVDVGDSFTEREASAPSAGRVTTSVPPLHPSCRCAVGLVV